MTSLVSSNLEIFKLFSDNEDFKCFVTQTSFKINFNQWEGMVKGRRPDAGRLTL